MTSLLVPSRRASPVHRILLTVFLAAFLAAGAVNASGATAATGPAPGIAGFFPGAQHDPAIPTADSLLGYPLGERAATAGDIERCLRAWAAASPHLRLYEHGRTWEGRPLLHLAISAADNIAQLDTIRADWAAVADPRRGGQDAAERRAAELPGTAWLAFSIHGDEISPADAALALIYHLIAGTDPDVVAMRRELVVLVDPLMNPDGRDRYLRRVAETAGAVPSGDDQSIQQRGAWPWGRTNHYLTDLNRDWTFAAQPETRARLSALAGWHPLFFLDAHEMGLDSETFLFYPPRAPFNPYLPLTTRTWWERFGRDEATAFDAHGWRYYTGEWADWWFTGYSDSWGTLRGGIGILHEQAGITAGAVRISNGQLLGYQEAVHHHVAAAWANLTTLRAHRADLARDLVRGRRQAHAVGGQLAGHSLAILPTQNSSRLNRFVEVLQLHGAELHRLDRAWETQVRDPLGRERSELMPAGTLLVNGRQPEGRWLRALLDFDVPLPSDVVTHERQELVAGGNTLLYDLSGWSLPLLYGLPALEVAAEVPAGTPNWPSASIAPPAATANRNGETPLVGVAFSGADDASVIAAARLLNEGWKVRLAEEATVLAGVAVERGGVLVLVDDNRDRASELLAATSAVGTALGLTAQPLSTGLAAGDLADLGGSHFLLLATPRVALAGYGSVEPTHYGSLWQHLDRELGLETSQLTCDDLANVDLRRYNVLVVAPGCEVDSKLAPVLASWTANGGTLIAINEAASELAVAAKEISKVRRLPDALDELATYRLAVARGWADLVEADRAVDIRVAATASSAVNHQVVVPWQGLIDDNGESKTELARRDAWAERFMPPGALLAGRVDAGHWLTAGVDDALPLFTSEVPVLLVPDEVAAPVRFGVLSELPSDPEAPSNRGNAESAWQRLGWSAVPTGYELLLRMSGLLWPEAAERLANAAYMTREARGHGQVILFAGHPVYRSTTWGTARLFSNAVVYGPGCGTTPLITP